MEELPRESLLLDLAKPVYEAFEALLADPSSIGILNRVYGGKLFSCNVPGCSEKFDTHQDRGKHLDRHTRPWRCNEAECNQRDHQSKRALSDHKKQYHEPYVPQGDIVKATHLLNQSNRGSKPDQSFDWNDWGALFEDELNMGVRINEMGKPVASEYIHWPTPPRKPPRKIDITSLLEYASDKDIMMLILY